MLRYSTRYALNSDRTMARVEGSEVYKAKNFTCKGGLCFCPSRRVTQLAGSPSLHVNRPADVETESRKVAMHVTLKMHVMLK